MHIHLDACFAVDIQILFSFLVDNSTKKLKTTAVCTFILLHILLISLISYANQMYFASWNTDACELSRLHFTESLLICLNPNLL